MGARAGIAACRHTLPFPRAAVARTSLTNGEQAQTISHVSAEALAIVAVGVTLPAVLVPLLLSVRSNTAALRADVQAFRAEVRSDVANRDQLSKLEEVWRCWRKT